MQISELPENERDNKTEGPMRDTIAKNGARQIVWADRQGVTHLCEGAEIHPGIRLLWTRCATGTRSGEPGSLDVPANAAWLRTEGDQITCQKCTA